MRKPIASKFSSRLIILLPVIAILAGVFLIAYKQLKLDEELIAAEIGEQARILSEQTSIGIATFIRNTEQFLQHGTRELSLAGLDTKEARSFIDHLYQSFAGDVTAVALLDSEGNGLTISPDKFADVFVGSNFSYRDYFQNVKATKKPYISSLFTTAANNKRIAVAVPVIDADRVSRGVIAAFLDTELINKKFIEKIEFRRKGYGILTDSHGIILHHPEERYRGDNLLEHTGRMKGVGDKTILKLIEYVEKNNSGKVNFSIINNPEGRPVKKIIAYSSIPLGTTKWYLTIITDHSEATARTRESYFYILALVMIVAGSLGAAALIYSKFESAKVKAFEEEMRTREWEETFNAMSDLIYIVDADCNILKANKACCLKTGLRMEKIIGQKSYKVFFGSDKPLEDCPCVKSAAEGVAHVAEVQHHTRGETFLVTSSPLFYKRGRRPVQLIVHAKDISERVRAERELAEANRLLFEQKQLLEEQKEKLSKSMQELQSLQRHLINSEKLASLGRLTAGLAHEILNPLNIITMIAQLLIMSGKLDEEASKDVAKIKEQVDRAAKITDSLAAFARQRKADKVETDLNEVLDRTLMLVESEMTRENIVLVKNYSQNLPHVMVDQDQISQVILNLLTNAREAMPGGGQLTIETRALGGRAEMVFSDSGAGMGKEILDKIFEPFFTTKDVGSGVGLGLPISYGIVENHGGTIRVKSEPGKGSTFIVELPAMA